jgi:hypothetical protein
MRTTTVVLLTLLSATARSAAHADPAAGTAPPQMLRGQVRSDTTGMPIVGVTVFVATAGGLQQTTETDEEGRYVAQLYGVGHYNLIFAFGSSRSSRSFDVEPRTDIALDAVLDDSGETIQVRGHYVPPVLPTPVKDPNILPRYSDKAALGDYWSKAWLLLDIDATGTVQRVKFLKHPGHDLDPIAVETALATRFSPARDLAGQPIGTQVVWPIEWPAYWWLVHGVGLTTYYNPDWGKRIGCLGSAPLNLDRVSPTLRDCSKPDLTKAASEPWIARR